MSVSDRLVGMVNPMCVGLSFEASNCPNILYGPCIYVDCPTYMVAYGGLWLPVAYSRWLNNKLLKEGKSVKEEWMKTRHGSDKAPKWRRVIKIL